MARALFTPVITGPADDVLHGGLIGERIIGPSPDPLFRIPGKKPELDQVVFHVTRGAGQHAV